MPEHRREPVRGAGARAPRSRCDRRRRARARSPTATCSRRETRRSPRRALGESPRIPRDSPRRGAITACQSWRLAPAELAHCIALVEHEERVLGPQEQRAEPSELLRRDGKHITINATGAVAAALLDIGVPAEIMRGSAVLARCAGLVGHVLEEARNPAMRAIWDAAERAVPDAEP